MKNILINIGVGIFTVLILPILVLAVPFLLFYYLGEEIRTAMTEHVKGEPWI